MSSMEVIDHVVSEEEEGAISHVTRRAGPASFLNLNAFVGVMRSTLFLQAAHQVCSGQYGKRELVNNSQLLENHDG